MLVCACVSDALTSVGRSQKQPGFRVRTGLGHFPVVRPQPGHLPSLNLIHPLQEDYLSSWHAPLRRQSPTSHSAAGLSLSFPIFKVGVGAISISGIMSVDCTASG